MSKLGIGNNKPLVLPFGASVAPRIAQAASHRQRLNVCGIHCDIVDPRRLELEAAKEILAEVYGVQIWVVDGLIRQGIVKFHLMGMEFRLYASRFSLS